MSVAALALAGCGEKLERPSAVPADAVFIVAPRGGCWQICQVDEAIKGRTRCQVYNRNGRRIYDEAFLPYDEGAQLQSNELALTDQETCDTVKLTNGRLLLPGSEFELRKKYWDWRLGKQSTP